MRKGILFILLVAYFCSARNARAEQIGSELIAESYPGQYLVKDTTSVHLLRLIEVNSAKSSQPAADTLRSKYPIVVIHPDTVVVPTPPPVETKTKPKQNAVREQKTRSVAAPPPPANLIDSILAALPPMRKSTTKKLSFKDTMVYNRLFVPIVFKGELFPRKINLLPHTSPKKLFSLRGSPPWSYLYRSASLDSLRTRAQQYIINAYPQYVTYDIRKLPKTEASDKLSTIDARFQFYSGTPTLPLPSIKVSLPDLPRWFFIGRTLGQMSQIYISPNWYQGGVSNLSILAGQQFVVKYADYKLIQFSADFVWRFNMITDPEDKLRGFRLSEDLIQLNTKFGVKAWNKFYYTTSFFFKSQLFNNYKQNSHDLLSAFLTPGQFNVGLGLDYQYKPSKGNFEASFIVSPFSYNYLFAVNHTDIDPVTLGIPEGHALESFGSSVQVNFKWSIFSNVILNTRFFYFTSYKGVQVEMENNIDFFFNRFFSTRLNLASRFDDRVALTETNRSFFQFKEVLSVGLNYFW